MRRQTTSRPPLGADVKIGIIGAGNIGGNLTRRFTAAGHDVSVANSRGPETLAELVAETGAKAVTVAEAAQDADVVVVTIPQKRISDLPAGVLDGVASGAVIIDTGNYYPQRDGLIAAIEDGTTESRWVSDQLGVPVVKAFNGIYAAHLLTEGRPTDDPSRRALPISGDDAAAKATVTTLLEEIGFDAVDAGALDESWRQQPGTPSYGLGADAAGIREALAAASPDRTAEWRA
jgi:predicted dinucleotide-binding enzyme